MTQVAAIFVQEDGCYADLPGVDPWGESLDAREYSGPWPVVAHSPCQRWGKYHGGAPRKPHQFVLGADKGMFAAALHAVRAYGGVLEHPANSHAWHFYHLATPPKDGGWVKADRYGGWTCCVYQGHYGHFSDKATWLYAAHVELPELIWGDSNLGPHPDAVKKHGYKKAVKIGRMAWVGGKDKTRIREATPPAFRDVLLSIARTARPASIQEINRRLRPSVQEDSKDA